VNRVRKNIKNIRISQILFISSPLCFLYENAAECPALQARMNAAI
jgi:hypothetical protein